MSLSIVENETINVLYTLVLEFMPAIQEEKVKKDVWNA